MDESIHALFAQARILAVVILCVEIGVRVLVSRNTSRQVMQERICPCKPDLRISVQIIVGMKKWMRVQPFAGAFAQVVLQRFLKRSEAAPRLFAVKIEIEDYLQSLDYSSGATTEKQV